jgi:hypothetical protein
MGEGALSAKDLRVGQGVWILFEKSDVTAEDPTE